MANDLQSKIEVLHSKIKEQNISIRQIAKECRVNVATLSNLFTKNTIPPTKWQCIYDGIKALFQEDTSLLEALENVNKTHLEQQNKGEDMPIIKCTNLSQMAKEHFQIIKNPFDDPQKIDQVYSTPRNRFRYAQLKNAVMTGGFVALVGQSGSGKTTFKKKLYHEFRDGEKCIFIEPHTIVMSADGKAGTLKARDILVAMLSNLRADSTMPTSSQTLQHRVHKALIENSRAGFTHCLIIDEAHKLHTATLSAIKNIWDLTDGLERLLSVVLVAQNELMEKVLTETNMASRDVTQRCEDLRLAPVDSVKDYLQFKFEDADLNVLDYFDEDALETMDDKLIVARTKDGKVYDDRHPLAINNLACQCMNYAAEIPSKKVTAKIVRGV